MATGKVYKKFKQQNGLGSILEKSANNALTDVPSFHELVEVVSTAEVELLSTTSLALRWISWATVVLYYARDGSLMQSK